MPQDTIIEVLRTEEKMNQIREQTAADCRQKLLMAQRSADRLREQARADAERQAAQATYHALEEASVQWEHKKEEARQRIPQAARWIVEKVVER